MTLKELHFLTSWEMNYLIQDGGQLPQLLYWLETQGGQGLVPGCHLETKHKKVVFQIKLVQNSVSCQIYDTLGTAVAGQIKTFEGNSHFQTFLSKLDLLFFYGFSPTSFTGSTASMNRWTVTSCNGDMGRCTAASRLSRTSPNASPYCQQKSIACSKYEVRRLHLMMRLIRFVGNKWMDDDQILWTC